MKKIAIFLFVLVAFGYAKTIKDVSNIVGIRDNQLIGYGLVVGLSGTGDKSKFTMQSLQNLLRNSYIKIPAGSINSKNIAAVMVTGDLPAFARQGDKIRVKVSAIGDSKSINNGELLLTQLKGVDGSVYALAQGKIISNKDNPTTGFIYNGATVENEVPFALKDETQLTLSLLQNSAKTADTIQRKINQKFGNSIAQAIDTRTVDVLKPSNISMVRFISMIEEITIDSSIKKKIIIDTNRETVIAGADIVVKPITVSRADFTLRIKQSQLNDEAWNNPAENQGVDIGDDVKIGNKPVEVNLNNALINSQKPPTISDLMRAMKVMKLPIKDIIETIKMIKDLGAIDADLEVRG